MATAKTLILTEKQIEQKINRIAYQIYEGSSEEKDIILAGIVPNGYLLAGRIATVLENISPIKVKLVEINVDKENPSEKQEKVSLSEKEFKNKVIVLVDDVLNSGKTLIYGVRHFLQAPVKRIKTAVLVDRNHTRYPVKADFVGLSLSTTLQEHVSVEMDKKGKAAVYLL